MDPETTTKTAAARLTEIEVDEVSLVDKAANKRVFLIVKNATGAPTAEPPAGDPPRPAQPPAGDPPPAAEPPPAAPTAADPATPPGAVPTTELTDVDKKVPGEPATARAPAADQDSESRQIEKRGAKMAKERLARFKAAYAQLGDLIAELETATAEMAEATEALEESTDATKAASERQSAVVAKVAGLEGRVAELEAKLAASEGKLTAANEKIAKQAEVITKARYDAVGNSVEVEGGAPPPQKVAWPRDLNEERRPRRQAAGR